MRADLELLAALFVDVGATENRVTTDLRRQRHGTRDASARALGSLDDVRSGPVEQLVIERLEADADLGGVSHVPVTRRSS